MAATSITRKYSPNPHNHRNFVVKCHSHSIFTTVTSTPSVVRRWLFGIRRHHTHRLRRSRFIVGLGVQWTPNSEPGYENPPATLQLCVGRQCLIFQLHHAPNAPLSLRRFLSNPDITFVGISNRNDDYLLQNSKHKLSVLGLIDLVDVASEKIGCSRRISMEKLADLVLGMGGVKKEKWVGRSDWDASWLSDDQVKYACLDVFVSFLMGKALRVWNWDQDLEH